jgi:hypothetical protein
VRLPQSSAAALDNQVVGLAAGGHREDAGNGRARGGAEHRGRTATRDGTDVTTFRRGVSILLLAFPIGRNSLGRRAAAKDAAPAHPFEIATCCKPLQPSCCRGVARISISETPKMNSTAKLMTLMTASGMFSRHFNNSASHRYALRTRQGALIEDQPTFSAADAR